MSERPQAVTSAPRRSRGRSFGFYVLLVLAGLLLFLSAFAVWINRVALNTDEFSDTATELIEDPAIRQAVAQRAVDELFSNVDVEAALEERLPENTKSLAGPMAAALQQAAPNVLERALEEPLFQRLWTDAVEQAHTSLVRVLEGDAAVLETDEGVVVLDLRNVVLEVADRLGIGDEVDQRLPESAGRIEILQSDELDTAQNAFQLLKTLAWFLPILTLLAFAGAVALAPDRRAAVRGVGIALVVVGVLGLLAAALTGNYVVNALAEHREGRAAADNAWDILTSLMRSSFRWLVTVGVLFVVAWWLAGRSRTATSVRRALAPFLQARWWAYAALAVVTAILLATGPAVDFARVLAVALLVALGVVWIELTRKQALLEFPNARTTSIADELREKVEGWWEELRKPEAPSPAPVGDVSARLASLTDLHAQGALTDEEFADAKARVLAGE